MPRVLRPRQERRRRSPVRYAGTAIVAAVALLAGGAPAAVAHSAPAQHAPSETVTTPQHSTKDGKPLPENLEKQRAKEAAALYGDPDVKPMDQRKTSVISLGDSEISGEGVGDYEDGTAGPDNWCHRSEKSAIHRTGLADIGYNVACSGASTANIRIGGEKQFDDELVQSDNLAIKARNTKIKMITLVIGANDDLQFGPVMTDCVTRRLLSQGPCQAKYEPDWQNRIDRLVPKVEQTIKDLRTVMADAGYAKKDYKLVSMSYPSPIGPDMKDNPDFPGYLAGGCVGYVSDAAWARNSAVPMFEKGMRKAAKNAGSDYLDASRLFHGHEVCSSNTWARGLSIDLSNPVPPDENSVRQSFHPNERGHGAFATCLSEFYDSGSSEASCADPASTGTPKLYPGSWTYQQYHNDGASNCVGPESDSTRVGTKLQGQKCGQQRAQGFYHDSRNHSLHSELSHDRCVAVSATEGSNATLADCDGSTRQQFTFDDRTIRPVGNTKLCLAIDPQAGDDAPLTAETCDGSPGQKFTQGKHT